MIHKGGARRGVRHQRHGINNRSVTVSLPGELDRQVRDLARRQGVSVSLIVTKAVEMYLRADFLLREERSV
jgi:predicted transcriptional regulator